MENWSDETDFIMSKNYEHFSMKKQIKFENYNLTNCLYKKKEIQIL